MYELFLIFLKNLANLKILAVSLPLIFRVIWREKQTKLMPPPQKGRKSIFERKSLNKISRYATLRTILDRVFWLTSISKTLYKIRFLGWCGHIPPQFHAPRFIIVANQLWGVARRREASSRVQLRSCPPPAKSTLSLQTPLCVASRCQAGTELYNSVRQAFLRAPGEEAPSS